MTKRFLDLLIAGLGLVMLAPLFVFLALAVKFDSPGPVFFRQERVGRFGRPFRIFKFRTMVHVQVRTGPELTVAGDVRITRVGAILRRYKIDELPQLIDVVRGTMSLVGPRPEVPKYVDHYPEVSRERVLSVRPGVTDSASLHYRNENDLLAQAVDPEREYIDVILPSKLQYALEYVDNVSVANDLRVLGLTLRTVFVPLMPLSRSLFFMNDSKLWDWLDRVTSNLHPRRRVFSAFIDGLTILACWHFTYLFRLGFERWQPGRPWYDDYVSFGVVAVYLLFLMWTGAERSLWRFFGFDDIKRLTAACMLAGLVCAVGVLMAQLTGVARAVLLLHPFSTLIGLCMSRMIYRMVGEHAHSRVNGQSGRSCRAIVLGAGEAARRLVAGIHLRDGWSVLALFDDDPAKHGLRIGGVVVFGSLDQLEQGIKAGATHVIVAMPGADPGHRARAFALAKATGLPVLTVPGQHELAISEGASTTVGRAQP